MAAGSFNPIIVRKPQASEPSKGGPSRKPSSTPINKDMPNSKNSTNVSSVEALSQQEGVQSYVISGEIELVGGLAFTGNRSSLEVYREIDGEKVNVGTVWLSQGRYEIVVDELIGYLVLELTDYQGETISMEEVDLYAWENLPYATNKIEGVHFLLKPLERGINFELHSSRSYKDKNIHVKSAHVIVDELARQITKVNPHKYQDKHFLEDSSLWVRTQKAKYWGTIAPIQAYGLHQVQAFPEAYLQALASDLDIKLNRKKGWVVGKVKGQQGPLKDVAIEVAGLNKNYKGIYFKTASELVFWPDKKLKKTTDNGLFVVPDLEPGIYAIRIRIGSDYFPAEVIKVEAEGITYLDLSYLEMKSASINIHDRAYGVNYLGAQIKVYGSDDELFVSGSYKDRLRYPSGQGTMTLEVDAGSEYMLAKTKVTRNLRSIRIPVVSQKWLNEILTTQGIEYNNEKGAIVGYVDGDDYDVLLSESIENEDLQIIYFDQKGQVIDEGFGVKGGGFIVVNAPEGLKSLAIIPQNKKSILMKSLTLEAGYVNSFETSL